MKRVSIGSWTFSLGPYAENPEPWTSLLHKLKRIGFDGIEVGGFSIHPRPENQPTPEDRERIKQEARETGMAFSSYIPDLWSESLLTSEDSSGYIRAFQRGVEFGAAIGAGKVCIDTLHPPETLNSMDFDTALRRLVATWKTCAKIAADHGCEIAWEFEPVYVFNKPSEVLRVVEAMDQDNFGIAFDTCHAEMISRCGAGQTGTKEILPGGALEFARKLRGKINHIHFMDCDGVVRRPGEANQCALGEGTLDLHALAAELNHAQRAKDCWVLDAGLPTDAWGMAARCKRHFDAMNGRAVVTA